MRKYRWLGGAWGRAYNVAVENDERVAAYNLTFDHLSFELINGRKLG